MSEEAWFESFFSEDYFEIYAEPLSTGVSMAALLAMQSRRLALVSRRPV